VRLSRDSVCTAWMPKRRRSTYIVCKERLIEAGLIFLRDQEHMIFRGVAKRSGRSFSRMPAFIPSSV